MAGPVHILDGGGSRTAARVTSNGQLVTAPYAYEQSKYVELAADDTAYNLFGPLAGQQFVITTIVLKADRQVSNVTDADVVVYEADADNTTTATKVLFQTAMVAGEQVQLTGINLLVGVGKFVNAKTSDDDVHCTLLGYYVPKVS